MRWMLPLLCSLALAAPSGAVDGVVEINHACATTNGCFPGDASGYPVTITGAAGPSYRLTSDLLVPDENTDGVLVSTSGVGIDLNGFSIVRVGCVGALLQCTPGQGTGSGIETSSVFNLGLSVKNGSITGMGRNGLFLADQAEVTGVRVRWNRRTGISVGAGSILADNTAFENGFDGLSAGVTSVVSNNTAYENGQRGIFAEAGSSVQQNSTYNNALSGISTGHGSTVAGNTAFNNAGDGIITGNGSTVIENSSVTNGDDGFVIAAGSTVAANSATSNGGDGFQTAGGSNVQRNNARGNVAVGLRLQADDAYRDNVVNGNGTNVMSGVNLFGNSCGGTVSCP